MVTKFRQENAGALPSPDVKHDYVRRLFDAIAPRYDLLNGVLSWQRHHRWREMAADQAGLAPGDRALDVCTGTGDLALALARRVGERGRVIGTDYSLPMLRQGDRKAAGWGQVRLALADTQNLPFADASFDAVTVAFGIRNVACIERGIAEMVRVVRPGGRVVVLEFNRPTHPIVAALYGVYSHIALPLVGGLLSGRRAAYAYLPASVETFLSREAMTELLRGAGLGEILVRDLNLGTVVIHRGVKLQ